MGNILNSTRQLQLFRGRYEGSYFVDKSEILIKLNNLIGKVDEQFICITRPRRFGKTVMTNLISSYYAKGLPSKEIFDTLKISKNEHYEEHLNQHNVISLYMSETPFECESYKDYIRFYNKKITRDLQQAFPQCEITEEKGPWDNFETIFQDTGETFIFILDEWDSFLHSDMFNEADGRKYLDFLKNLLKDRPYVELAYMTGILPIKKYSSGSELNMFKEYYFPTDSIYDTFFGFTTEEVKELCERNQKNGGKIQYEDLAEWYNGYYTFDGNRLYNPRSVNSALSDNQVKDYWTETGPGSEILNLIKNNVESVRDDIVRMVSGEKIEMHLDDFTASLYNTQKKEEIFSAMIIFGYLSYHNGYLSIPNQEIMKKFQQALKDQSLGYIAELATNSDIMLKATLDGNTAKMEELLEFVHNTEIPILQYNNEYALSCIVNLIYLNARDKYRIEREDKAGKGFADFIFYPKNPADTAIILELKKDDTTQHAIEQVLNKKYDTKLQEMKNGTIKHTGKVLAVGIAYDSKTGKHHCEVRDITAD